MADNHRVENQKSMSWQLFDSLPQNKIMYGDVGLYSISIPVLTLKFQIIFNIQDRDKFFSGLIHPQGLGIKISCSV